MLQLSYIVFFTSTLTIPHLEINTWFSIGKRYYHRQSIDETGVSARML